MEIRSDAIKNFEQNKDALIKNCSIALNKRAAENKMTMEEYLRYWVYNGLAPDVRLLREGEEQIYFPKL